LFAISACHVSDGAPVAGVALSHCGFGVVELHTARKATLCKQAKLRDDELVELWARG
jgi:hypothetical protein|tara:strand:- start:14250 stop:14420 length:171 start_codon:yes stop_codon:yes gene_type:complete